MMYGMIHFLHHRLLLLTSLLLSLCSLHVHADSLSRQAMLRRVDGVMLKNVPVVTITPNVISHTHCYAQCLLDARCIAINVLCAGAGAVAKGESCECQLLADVDDTKLVAEGGGTHFRPETTLRYPDPPTGNTQYRDSGLLLDGRSEVFFSVKACSDAFICISNEAGCPEVVGESYEIIIGGWGNTGSHLRSPPNDGITDHLRVQTHGVLSCNEYRRFWISWASGNTIEVGRGWQVEDPSSQFLSLLTPSLDQLRYLSVSGFYGIEAAFMIVGA